jgi:hypothetical protein
LYNLLLAFLALLKENIIMFEILIRIETLCLNSQPLILFGYGLLVMVLGLLLWLAGSYFSSVILGLLGAVVGSACGLLLSQWLNFSAPLSMAAAAAAFAIATVIFKNVLIIILASVVFALAGGTVYTSLILKETPQQPSSQLDSASVQPFSQMDSSARLAYADQVTVNGNTFLEKLKLLIRDALQTMSPYKWKILLFALVGGLSGLLLIWVLRKLILALCYSGVGTFLILIGAEVLLLALNFRFCSFFQSRRSTFTIIFLSMLGFGTIFQLIVTKSKTKKVAQEKGGRNKTSQ